MESCISCHIKGNRDVANRYIINFIYLAQSKSNALFRIEVNTLSQNEIKSLSFGVYFSFQINISCFKLKKHEPPRILLHFVLLHFALLLSIAFCVKSYYILRYYYILWQMLVQFGLLLHYFLCQLLQYVALQGLNKFHCDVLPGFMV